MSLVLLVLAKGMEKKKQFPGWLYKAKSSHGQCQQGSVKDHKDDLKIHFVFAAGSGGGCDVVLCGEAAH